MKQVKRIIRKADLFGVQLTLNVKQQEKFHSTCSGLLSLIMVAFLCYIFLVKFISVLNRENYSLKVQSLQSKDPNYSIMNSNNFMMAVKITDPFQIMYPNENKTSYKVSVQQYSVTTLKNGTKVRESLQSYNLEKCEQRHFQEVNFESQEQIYSQLSSYLCFPIDYQLFLQGNYNSEIFYYPKLQVQICTSDECYSQSERSNVTSNTSTIITLSTLIQSSIFMSNQTENFIFQYIISDFYLSQGFETQTVADLFFKQTKVLVDNTLISFNRDPLEDNFWSYDVLNYRQFQVQLCYINFYLSQNPVAQPDTLFQINLRLYPEQQIITKTADKLDLLISYFGGMLKFFTAIFGLLALNYNSMAMKLSLANSLYQFNVPKIRNGRIEFSYDKLLNYIQFQINKVDELLAKLKNHAFQVGKMGSISKFWGNMSASLENLNSRGLLKKKMNKRFQNMYLKLLYKKVLNTRKSFFHF